MSHRGSVDFLLRRQRSHDDEFIRGGDGSALANEPMRAEFQRRHARIVEKRIPVLMQAGVPAEQVALMFEALGCVAVQAA